jgi:signal transduction histidine kinase
MLTANAISDPGRTRTLRAVIIALTLLTVAGAVLVATLYLRGNVQRQIAGRDAQILYALWLSQRTLWEESTPEANPENPGEQMLQVLETSRLLPTKAVLGARLFGPDGNFIMAFPEYVPEGTLDPQIVREVAQLRPAGRFQPEQDMAAVSLFGELEEGKKISVLEIMIPLHSPGADQLYGIAQFLLDGESMAAEFLLLDKHLAIQSTLAFLAVSGILLAVLLIGFQQLQRSHALLAQRTASLLKANQELALAAKVSAIGAVTSHLIHGLKSPLSGLQSFMSNCAPLPDATGGEDWEQAVSTTRRMQALINETVRVLQENQAGSEYELSISELLDILSAKMRPLAQERQVSWKTSLQSEGQLTNRDANLILLILENLATNAIQATPPGQSVALTARQRAGFVEFEVADEGPGLSPSMKQRLFQPCFSSKGGSGIGLAISHQLSAFMQGRLELKSSSERGSVFMLAVPLQGAAAVALDQRGA